MTEFKNHKGNPFSSKVQFTAPVPSFVELGRFFVLVNSSFNLSSNLQQFFLPGVKFG
jgi:hypothetical protein